MSVENLGLARVQLRARMAAAVMLFGSIIPFATVASPLPGGGTPIGGQYNASDAPASYQSRHQVAVDAVGNSVVVWEDNATGAGGAWTIKGRCFDASGLPKANSFLISSNSSSGTQRFPAVAMNATGDFMVAWEDFNGSATDQGHRIDARRFTAACDVGSAGSQFVVRASAGDEAHTPSVALTGGGDSWIFWNDNFVAKGAKYSAFLTMPSATITESQAGFQYAPVVAVDASGNVALAFTLKDVTSNFDIYAQGFASNGSALTGAASTAAVLINTTTAGVQDTPSISMDAAGKLVIAWESDVSAKEVQAQIFQLSKNIPQTFSPVGTEITVVAPSTTHLQAAPSVAMDYAGNFWVAWQDVDTSGPGITARWYSASSSSFPGAAIRVNATMANAQVLPTIAADTDGDLLTAWIDQGAEGQSADDVQLRRFSGHESVDLSLTGSDSPSPVVAGSNLAYTLTVNNLHALTQNAGVNDTSIGAANGIYLSDTLPNSVSYSGYSGTGWTCSSTLQVVNCTYANTLLPATSAGVTINVLTSSNSAGTTITNVTSIGANQYDANTANNSLSDAQMVQAPSYTLSASTNSVNFGSVNVGSTANAPSAVTLTNTGNLPITFNASAFAAGGTNGTDFGIVSGSDSCSGQTISVGATCSVTFTFTPGAFGTRSGTESVNTVQTLGSAVTISVGGTGLGAGVSLSPSSLTFSNQAVGTTSATQVVTLTNTGNATLTLTSVLASSGFIRTSDCTAVISAGASCSINVYFQPGAQGPYTGQITVTSSGPNSPNTVSLSGTTLQIPANPTGLTASSGNAQVTLNWTAVSGAASYSVYTATCAGCETTPATATVTGSSTAVITGLSNGTKYYFVVQANNASGHSANSNEVNATPVLPVPVAPTGLTAMAGDAQVTLNWTAVSGATSYSVYKATCIGCEAAPAAAVVTNGSNMATVTGLSNGTKYYFVVQANNASGHSLSSNEANATPMLAIPAVPTGLSAVAGNAQVTLNWTAVSGAASYSVYKATCAGCEAMPAAATVTGSSTAVITGLSNGTKYYFVVQANNAAGHSASSNEVNATPVLPVPGAPTGLTAMAGDAQVTLNWAAVSGAASYSVYKATCAGCEALPAAVVVTDGSNMAVVTGLSNGTKYYFVVQANNSAGHGPSSNEASAIPLTPN